VCLGNSPLQAYFTSGRGVTLYQQLGEALENFRGRINLIGPTKEKVTLWNVGNRNIVPTCSPRKYPRALQGKDSSRCVEEGKKMHWTRGGLRLGQGKKMPPPSLCAAGKGGEHTKETCPSGGEEPYAERPEGGGVLEGGGKNQLLPTGKVNQLVVTIWEAQRTNSLFFL